MFLKILEDDENNLLIQGISQLCHKFTTTNYSNYIVFKNIVFFYYCDTGSSTLGEIFNPVQDCPDVVDKLPGAKDGFYWIILKNKVHKVENMPTVLKTTH